MISRPADLDVIAARLRLKLSHRQRHVIVCPDDTSLIVVVKPSAVGDARGVGIELTIRAAGHDREKGRR